MDTSAVQQLHQPREHLANIVRGFAVGKNIVVVGDLLADQFLYGAISRVSREAPVLILRHERTETSPGGAANCAANLAALGAHTALVGIVGRDEQGRALLEKLRAAKVNCERVLIAPDARTTTKVRVLAGQTHSTRQQVIRIDYESELLDSETLHGQLREELRASLKLADAVIISDYNYGVANHETAKIVREETLGREVAVIVDSRFGLQGFSGFTSATPNEDEVEQLLGTPLTDETTLRAAGAQLREKLNYEALLITRGSNGMMLFQTGAEALHIEPVGAREPVDVTGAGDTVIAAYALALASGATFADAAHIANHAGGLVVMKRGTASINAQELLSSILR
ncbi:MAG: bifunctional heptose 7-phosphate kinase/heptose 1-phosphate adenyltransferase [Pyrinomonadaceae bacterium]